jgi:hypothetical protein
VALSPAPSPRQARRRKEGGGAPVSRRGEEMSDNQAYATQLLASLGAQAIPGVRCVVTARRDLLDPLLALGDLGRVLTRGTLLVSPMTDATWSDVLDQALEAYGYRLEDETLRAELLGQLRGTATAMPLVEFALTQLWERRDPEKKVIPRAALKAIGGIAGALEAHADATLAALDEAATEIAYDVLLALTTAQGTRATRTLAELRGVTGSSDRADKVIATLESARLVVREPEGLTLAHEALLTHWSKLRSLMAEAREDRLLAEELARDANAWAGSRDVDRLWKRRRLAAAEHLVRREAADLDDTARAFVGASRRAERRRWGAAALVAALVAGAAVGGTALYIAKTNQALMSERAARSHEEEAKTDAEHARANAQKAQIEQEILKQQFQNDYEDLKARVAKATTAEELREIQAEIERKRHSLDAKPPPTASAPAPPAVPTPARPVASPNLTSRSNENLGAPP